jgi:transcriptional regulator with XRE-family HTH domain
MAQKFPDTPTAVARLRRFPPFVRAVGAALGSARMQAQMQLQVLAQKVGSNHGSLSRIENAKYAQVGDLARRAAESLGVDYNELERSAWASLTGAEKTAFEGFEGPQRQRSVAAPKLGSPTADQLLAVARELAQSLEQTGGATTHTQFVTLLEHVLRDSDPSSLISAIADILRARV